MLVTPQPLVFRLISINIKLKYLKLLSFLLLHHDVNLERPFSEESRNWGCLQMLVVFRQVKKGY